MRFTLYYRKLGVSAQQWMNDNEDIVKKYNELPIFSVKDIKISATEICSLLDKKPGSFIKDIYTDLENKILDNVLKNDYDQLCEYVKQNY